VRLVGAIAYCDFGWPAQRTVGEFDGKVKYGRLLGPARSRAMRSTRRSCGRTRSERRTGRSCAGPGPICATSPPPPPGSASASAP